jgi:UDP-4-amino-4,6-dideoxy-N-acetyl-beta-L-altrosamine N-acetyltransferase
MEEGDRELVLTWRNLPNVRNNMYTNHVISAEEHGRWFEASRRDPAKRLLVCVDLQDVPVGVVVFYEINSVQRTATWAFYAGSSERRGIGSEMEFLALDFAFGELQLEKLNCEVLAFNMPVVDFHRKYGFRIEGIFRAHYERDGKRHDVYRLAHFRKAWLERVRPTLVGEREGRRSPVRVGAVHREQMPVTRELTQRFAETTGDNNAIHLDDAAAQAAGFQGTLAHGMLIAAGIAKILGTTFPGHGTVLVSQSLQFLRPVYPDVQLEYALRIASRIGHRAILVVTVSNPQAEVVVAAEAEVVMPKER